MESRKSKIFSWIFVFMFGSAATASAQEIGGLHNVLTAIDGFFGSDTVKLIFTIAVAAIGVAAVVNRENHGLKMKLIGVGLGIFLVLSAGSLVSFLWDSAQ